MNLQETKARLAEIDTEVRAATTTAEIDKLEVEKKELLTRKGELEDLETRKQTALDITAGAVNHRVIDRVNIIRSDFKGMTPEEVRGTEEYRSAFFKGLLGRPLSEIEKRSNEIASTDAAGIIPTVALNRVFDLLKQYAPLLNEVTLLQVPGNVTFAVESTNNAAAIHTQNAAVTPAADVMAQVNLAGFEIIKVLRISATIQAMAVNAFEGWLTDYLARGIAAKIGAYLIYGSGSSQPKGVDYMDTWADGTNAVDYDTNITPDEIVELVSYLKGGYHNGAKFLMKASTFWSQVVMSQDDSSYKILTPDYKRILGYEVLLDDNCAAGDIFFGNFRAGLVANLSQNIRIDRSADSGFLNNAVDYRGTCIFDCDLTHTEGFVKAADTLTAGA